MISRLDTIQKDIYKDIIRTIVIVILSIPLWNYFEKNNINKIGNEFLNYNYINYEEINNPCYLLTPMNDIDGLHQVETKDIIVSNYSNTIDDYYLVLKTSYDISDRTRININNHVDYLNNYEKVIKDNNTYYILDYESIVASSQKYVISLWNKEGSFTENINYDITIVTEL